MLMTQETGIRRKESMSDNPTPEIVIEHPVSGWLALAFALLLLATGAGIVLQAGPPLLLPAVALLLVLTIKGLAAVQPNEALVLVLFGRYTGSVRRDGFFWVNPFCTRRTVSLRMRNFNTPTLKVNDRNGSPIEVAAVVTWRVDDSAMAVFDIDDYQTYTHVQSEMGLREVTGRHAYDGGPNEVSLRGSFETVSRLLADMVQQHVDIAGVRVLDAKLTHLAYAPEIASVMLRRQQAEAVVQARERLVEGAVGMAKSALARIEHEQIARLSDAARATLLTSLMTVLLSESGAQPVLQTGQSQP
jgi:regulator of protease activity HflC (stomatin/prohibitin superfamily)